MRIIDKRLSIPLSTGGVGLVTAGSANPAQANDNGWLGPARQMVRNTSLSLFQPRGGLGSTSGLRGTRLAKALASQFKARPQNAENPSQTATNRPPVRPLQCLARAPQQARRSHAKPADVRPKSRRLEIIQVPSDHGKTFLTEAALCPASHSRERGFF